MELSAEQLSLIANSYAMEKKTVMEKYSMTSIEVDVMLFLANNPQFDTAADPETEETGEQTSENAEEAPQ